jgi:hypothetical protein
MVVLALPEERGQLWDRRRQAEGHDNLAPRAAHHDLLVILLFLQHDVLRAYRRGRHGSDHSCAHIK